MRQASRYPTQKDAATNTASIAQKPVGAWSRLSPTPIETAGWRGAGGVKTSPHAPTRRGPFKTDETKNLPDATTATTSPRYSSHPPAKTPWRQRKKTQEIPYGCAREDATRAYLSRGLRPPIDGGEPRHCGRPKEVRPAPGTARRAEQKARRQMGETFETPNLHKAQRQRAKPSSMSAQGPPPA